MSSSKFSDSNALMLMNGLLGHIYKVSAQSRALKSLVYGGDYVCFVTYPDVSVALLPSLSIWRGRYEKHRGRPSHYSA
jgi:hypothetical protein